MIKPLNSHLISVQPTKRACVFGSLAGRGNLARLVVLGRAGNGRGNSAELCVTPDPTAR
jgi:hypothetical protein